jgi:hypothetical protein
MSDIPSPRDRVLAQYGRKNQAGDPILAHHGDCGWYAAEICTCGLLADLAFHGESVQGLFAKFSEQWAEHFSRLSNLNRAIHCPGPLIVDVTSDEDLNKYQGGNLTPGEIAARRTADQPLALVMGGVYKARHGYTYHITIHDVSNGLFSDGGRKWSADGRCRTYDGRPGHPSHDLVELVARIVPIDELEQLQRAQALQEMAYYRTTEDPPPSYLAMSEAWRRHHMLSRLPPEMKS